jgi:hypothetical protein
MKKIILTLFAGFIFSSSAFAQAYDGIIEYDKKKQDGFLIDYFYTSEAVENAIVKRMEKLGYKPKDEKGLFNKDKGFKIFKGAFISEANAEKLDYIIRVESKSRKKQDESVISMILLRDGVNAKIGFDALAVDKAKSFLNNLKPDIEAADLEIKIKNAEESLAKTEKKLKGLKDDQAELEKKLANNKKDQENTQKDIENGRVSLEVLKSRRKTN